MGKALFLGLSAAFFIAYSLIANALFVDTSQISGFTSPANTPEADNCTGILIISVCSTGTFNNVPFIGGLLQGTADVFTAAGQIFSGFAQLITFNAGSNSASIVTLLLFTPLGFINAFIIFTAIRGSS